MTDPDIVVIPIYGEEIAVRIGRRTPDDAPWYGALVADVGINAEDARRIGERVIRGRLLRLMKREREKAAAALAALPSGGATGEGGK